MHELTERVRSAVNELLQKNGHSMNSFEVKAMDKVHREWLEDKIHYIVPEHGTTAHYSRGALKQVFGIAEKSLEEKFREVVGEPGELVACSDPGIVHSLLQRYIKQLAQIAEDHHART